MPTADAVPVRVGVGVVGAIIVFGLIMGARSLNRRPQTDVGAPPRQPRKTKGTKGTDPARGERPAYAQPSSISPGW